MEKNYQSPLSHKEFMKLYILFCMLMCNLIHAESVTLAIDHAQTNKKSHLLFAVVGKQTAELDSIAALAKKALDRKSVV